MEKISEIVIGLVRQALGFAGAYLVTKGIIDVSVWEGIAGFLLSSVSFGFGWYTKTTVPGQVWSVIRTGLTAISGVLVFKGWMSADIAAQAVVVITGAVGSIGSVVDKIGAPPNRLT